MNERINEFMQLEGLTAVKFAEIIEVQPSSISHLLSGRNRPNYDFLSKILLRFPKLNPDWIINGKGDIYRSNNSDITPINQESRQDTDSNVTYVNTPRTTQLEIVTPQSEATEIEITDVKQPKDETNSGYYMQSNNEVTNVNQMHFSSELSDLNSATAEKHIKDHAGASKIDQIVIFYSDGTFKEYINR